MEVPSAKHSLENCFVGVDAVVTISAILQSQEAFTFLGLSKRLPLGSLSVCSSRGVVQNGIISTNIIDWLLHEALAVARNESWVSQRRRICVFYEGLEGIGTGV